MLRRKASINARKAKLYYVAAYPREARENARIWDTHYRPYPLYDHLADWEAQLEEYRELVVEVQEIYEEHRGCRMG